MRKKKMTDEYVIRDRMFDLNWASGLLGSFIPRKWTLEERDAVERVFGKKALLLHEELISLIRDDAVGKYKFNINDKGEDK